MNTVKQKYQNQNVAFLATFQYLALTKSFQKFQEFSYSKYSLEYRFLPTVLIYRLLQQHEFVPGGGGYSLYSDDRDDCS